MKRNWLQVGSSSEATRNPFFCFSSVFSVDSVAKPVFLFSSPHLRLQTHGVTMKPSNAQSGASMLNTVEAVIDESGRIQWLEKVSIKGRRRVLITLLDDESQEEILPAAESALAGDWLNEDEDNAWEHLQKEA
ncbi:hypothetical protein [Marinobacter daqiaonensis]|nr:hypothetical protein [Marinobacter daqiaonensis]